jgi:glutamate synthase domain-containing protein 3
MNTKLTLNLDKEIIEAAKIYAKSNQVSLSKLIENYLHSLTRDSKKKSSISPLVESLTGIIPSDYDEKKDYREYIEKKYS